MLKFSLLKNEIPPDHENLLLTFMKKRDNWSTYGNMNYINCFTHHLLLKHEAKHNDIANLAECLEYFSL